jgi:hypothetical protein
MAIKHDTGKPKMSLLPPRAVAEVGCVLTYGADKYGEYNWADGGMEWSRLWSAAMRHMLAWLDGSDYDRESDLNHLAHAATNLLFLLEYQLRGLGTDDRYVYPDQQALFEEVSTSGM